jgi:outer membrane receptor for ferrienterochelin and colicins
MKGMVFLALTATVAMTVLLPRSIAAQEGAVLVVTGAKVEENIEDTVEAVEVVSAEEIAAMGARNVAEVMKNIPGVTLFERAQATVMMQGFDGAYVKVLIDGIEISGDEGGATPVSLLGVADIERIEIVRGASSVLYGSDAMGGVVNIITKKPEKDRLSFMTRQEFSSNMRYYGEGSLGWNTRRLSLFLGGGFDWDDGKLERQRGNAGFVDVYEVPSFSQGNLRGGMIWHHGRGDLELFGGWSDSSRESSSGLEGGYEYRDQKLEGGMKYSLHFSATAGMDGFASYRQHAHRVWETRYLYNSRNPYTDNFFRDMEGELRFSWDPLISHSLLFGVNAKREALESDDFSAEQSLIQLAAFAQDTWNIGARDRFRVVPGFRLDYRVPGDDSEDPLFKLTPKLSLRYDPLDGLILRLSYGMGFKIPSLKDNYWVFFHPAPNNWLILGNPNLKPETSHGFNIQADYAVTENFSAGIAAYYNYVVDKIETLVKDETPGSRPDSSGTLRPYILTRQYENVGRAITAGGDISLRYGGKRLKADGTYSLGIARGYDEDLDDYVDLTSQIPHQVNLGVSFLIPLIETTAGLQINWHAPRKISVAADSAETPDYLMTSLRLSKLFFGETLEAYGGIQNLCNNFHFIEGSGGVSQQDYYNLADDVIFTLGLIYRP